MTHPLRAAVAREIQSALRTYTGEMPGISVAQAVATDVLGAIRNECLIETVEQLEALPVGAVIRTEGPVIFLRELNGADEPRWFARAEFYSYEGIDIPLLAAIIWHPSWPPAPPQPPEPVSGEVSAADMGAAVVPW